MASAETVSIESDERGFELHLSVDEDVVTSEDGRVIINVQMVAEELYDAVKTAIGPWLYEMETARAWHRAGIHPGGLTDAEREEEVRCAALGLEGPNHKLWRAEGGGM